MKDAILFVLVGSEPVLGHSDFGASLFLVIGFVLFCFFFFFVLPAASPGGARPRCVLYSSVLFPSVFFIFYFCSSVLFYFILFLGLSFLSSIVL